MVESALLGFGGNFGDGKTVNPMVKTESFLGINRICLI